MTKRSISNNAFCIKFIVRDTNDEDLVWYNEIHDYCEKHMIPFVCRLFNSLENEEDCHYIESLPAVHIYHRGDYVKTIHTIDNPIISIHKQIQTYKDRKLMRKRTLRERILAFLRS